MEIPRLQRLKNLFRQTKEATQASSPTAQHTREPESQPAATISPQADAVAPVPDPSLPPTRVEPEPAPSEQIQQPEHIQQQPPQPSEQPVVTFYGLSDTGLKRSNNEDHFIVADLTRCAIFVEDNVLAPGVTHQLIGPHGTLLAVADGVGGHDDGEIASHIVVEAIAHTLFDLQQQELSTAERLTRATQEAHQNVRRYTSEVPGSHSMSSTLTAVHLAHDTMTIAQVGDSRAYLFANGSLTLLTEDQTIVYKMLQNGMLTEEEAQVHPDRHAILQAMGQERAISPVVTHVPFQPGDCLLVCSDGLSSYVEHQCIESILNEDADEQTQCQKLLEAAYAAGGDDNVTILLARLRPVLPS